MAAFDKELTQVLGTGLNVARAVVRSSRSVQRNSKFRVAIPYPGSTPNLLPQSDDSYSIHFSHQLTAAALRGEFHALALGALYHNPELHKRLRPASRFAAATFDALERIRVEYMGLMFEERFPRMRDELDAAFAAKQENLDRFTRVFNPSSAIDQFARATLLKEGRFYTPSTGRFHTWLWKHREEVYGRRFNRLLFTATDQRVYAGTALQILSECGFYISPQDKDGAEKELQEALEQNAVIKEKIESEQQREVPASNKKTVPYSPKLLPVRIIYRLLNAIDKAAFKVHSKVFSVGDFARNLSHKLSENNVGAVLSLVVISSAFVAAIKFRDEFMKWGLNVINAIKENWKFGAVVATLWYLSDKIASLLSPDKRYQLKKKWRQFKKRFVPYWLNRELRRAHETMQQVAAVQFHGYKDALTHRIATESAISTDYASYQRMGDTRINLNDLETLPMDDPRYRSFAEDSKHIHPRLRKALEDIREARTPVTSWEFNLPEGELLDPRQMTQVIARPFADTVHMQRSYKMPKEQKVTITFALSPAVMNFRMMPQIYNICAGLEKKGYSTEVIAQFSEAKNISLEGYGRISPIKTVLIKKSEIPVQRARAAFAFAHNAIFPDGFVSGETDLNALNHARTKYGKQAIVFIFGMPTHGSKHRTFKGKIEDASEVFEVREFEELVDDKIELAVSKNMVFAGKWTMDPFFPLPPNAVATMVAMHLKKLTDNHPQCGK